jgi:hypothetical protein
MDRLGWILPGLNGAADWGGDAADVRARVRGARAAGCVHRWYGSGRPPSRPGTVTGLDTSDHTARARVRVRDGSVQGVTCAVQPAAPHRIRGTTTMALVPSFLTPRLPADFTGYPELAGRGTGARQIVFSGLPGTGKSTLAEAAGRQLRVPVFAADWLLGSLTPFRGYHLGELLRTGAELLTTLAFRRSWPSWRGRAIEPLVREAVLRLAPRMEGALVGIESGNHWWEGRRLGQVAGKPAVFGGTRIVDLLAGIRSPGSADWHRPGCSWEHVSLAVVAITPLNSKSSTDRAGNNLIICCLRAS